MDGAAILAGARHVNFLPNWRVWHARPLYFFWQGLQFSGLTFWMTACGIILARLTVQYWSTGADLAVPLLYLDLFASSLVAATIYQAARAFGKMAQARQQVVALLPTGFVVATNTSTQPRYAVSYAEIAALQLRFWRRGPLAQRQRLALHLTTHQGETLNWEIDTRFGSRAVIAQHILADFKQVVARRTKAGRSVTRIEFAA